MHGGVPGGQLSHEREKMEFKTDLEEISMFFYAGNTKGVIFASNPNY